MATLLHSIGYGPVESLQTYLSRFALQSTVAGIDKDFVNIWICHKSIQRISELQKALNENYFDDENHKNHLGSYNESDYVLNYNIQNQFNSSEILHKITDKLHCCLANYIITECLILYNWGINSFELIFENKEFNIKVAKFHDQSRKRKKFVDHCVEYGKWRWILTKCENKNEFANEKSQKKKCDSYRNEADKIVRFTKKDLLDFRKLKQIYNACNNPKKNYSPHELFTNDKILYNKHHQWSKDHALCKPSDEEVLRSVLSTKIGTGVDSVTERLTKYDQCTRLRNILCFMSKKHSELQKYDGYGRILKHHLKSSGKRLPLYVRVMILTKYGPINYCRPCVEGFPIRYGVTKLIPISTTIVSSFIFDIIRKILPFEFFGTNRLRKKFFFEMLRIINGSKYESFTLQPIVQEFFNRRDEVFWLKEIREPEIAKRVTLKFFKWLLQDYIFLLLKHHFYITETGSSGYRLFYYRKNDIQRCVRLWLNSQISKKNISCLQRTPDHWNIVERKWVESGLIETNQGTSKMFMTEDTQYIDSTANVRFLPKAEFSGDIRLITNHPTKRTVIKGSETEKRKLFKCFMERKVKRTLICERVKYLLQYLAEKYGTDIGPLPSNRRLESAWKKAVHLRQTYGKLYFVKADICDAFGTILSSRLSEIVNEKIGIKGNQRLQLRKIKEYRVRKGQLHLSSRTSFSDRPKENSFLLSRSIYVGTKKKLPSYSAKELKKILDQIIFNQHIKIYGKYYKLNNGILQGSAGSCSPLLCDLYYSEMDKLHFADFINCSECILLRAVDDYLLITSDMQKATRFYEIIQNGIKEFNATFNKTKLRTNINGDEDPLGYLGLIFDFKNMTVKPDYTRYKNKGILSTMKLRDAFGNMFVRKIRFIEFRALNMVSLKLLPITLSDVTNDLSAVRESVFSACLVQASRILVLTRYLFRVNEKNDLDIGVVLSKSVRKIKRIVMRSNREISKDEIVWLFWYAALLTFRRFSGLFSNLLIIIRHRLYLIDEGLKKRGNEFLLNSLSKEIRSSKSWKELIKMFKIIILNTKPSKKLILNKFCN